MEKGHVRQRGFWRRLQPTCIRTRSLLRRIWTFRSSLGTRPYDDDRLVLTTQLCSRVPEWRLRLSRIRDSTLAHHHSAIARGKLAQRTLNCLFGEPNPSGRPPCERASESCGLHAGLVRHRIGISHWLLSPACCITRQEPTLFERTCNRRSTPDGHLIALSLGRLLIPSPPFPWSNHGLLLELPSRLYSLRYALRHGLATA